jgi:hypothetical protein
MKEGVFKGLEMCCRVLLEIYVEDLNDAAGMAGVVYDIEF